MTERLNDDFLEKMIIKGALADKMFLILISNAFTKEYFQNETAGKIYGILSSHVEEFKTIPSIDVITNLIDETGIREYIDEANDINFDISSDYDFLIEQTNIYLKDQAIKKAMLDSVGVIDNHGNLDTIRQSVEDALCKDLKVDLGLDYFEQLGERLRRMFTATDVRIPTYYPKFDEFINGGFPALTLSVILAQIHGFKCLSGNTKITIKNKKGEIEETKIQDFFRRFDTLKYKYIEEDNQMLGLQGMIEKYGEIEGKKRYNSFVKKISETSKNRNTLSYFIKKYGEDIGKEKHNNYIKKQKNAHTLIGRIEKYGPEGKKIHDKIISKSGNNIESYIKKYGEIEGKKKFEKRQINWNKTMKSKPPNEIKLINEKKKLTLENFQKKYGINIGLKKWINRCKKQSKAMRKIDVNEIDKYTLYVSTVRRLSEQQIKIFGLKKSKLRERGKYHLDHKVSICYGFNNNIPPEIISSIYNLEILPCSDNCSKHDKNSISLSHLEQTINEHNK